MSRLNDLIRQLRLKDPALADDLEREVSALADRRAFRLNFERHTPEAVELPGRRVRRGDKVRILPPRGTTPTKSDELMWRVVSIDRTGDAQVAQLAALDGEDARPVAVADLVVVAEFREPIYPGLVSTGKVERGADKPFHAVINAENYHALQTLLLTHCGQVDCIYIDPPYNSGAKDWKYNNDYVESDDLYRHSKWLAFMERRLELAKRLLNPANSVLIVTINEKEYLRLGLLLSQIFYESRIQMVSITINPKGAFRGNDFSKVDEFAFFVFLGDAGVPLVESGGPPKEVRWAYLRRSDVASARGTKKGGPRQFYPIYVDEMTTKIVKLGQALLPEDSIDDVPHVRGAIPVFPIREDGKHMNWGLTASTLQRAIDGGFVRVTPGHERQPYTLAYLTGPDIARVENGTYEIRGARSDGSKIVYLPGGKVTRPVTVWRESAHDAGAYGTSMLGALVPGRQFDFPKSLHAVEDCLRLFVKDKPEALIVDFFGGSGTTAHAVMRLNRQDQGRWRSIVITNNEVSAKEQAELRKQGLRPGDLIWEKWGICDYITKPRIEAAITGRTPDGAMVNGEYRFKDEFPMADGLEENVEFFTLTYEAPLRVASNREFGRIAPLLWLRAGSRGRRIDDISKGWDVAETYGVIADFDHVEEFLKALTGRLGAALAFIVTDEDWLFESMCRELPERVEPVRLYEAYLRNFELESGRGAR